MFLINKIRQKGLKPLLIKTIVFLFILFILDFVIGTFLGHLYSIQKPGAIYRINYSIDSTNQDILIFGASRANHHYVPGIFEKKMNLSCYNTGNDGQIIIYNYAVLKCVLQRYSPKIIILDLSHDELREERKSYDRLSALIPFYKTHPEIRSIIEMRSPYEKYKMVSHIYPYNSLIFTLLMGAFKSHEERKKINVQNGYIPLNEKCTRQLVTDTFHGIANLDSVKIKVFESFIKDCKKSNVKLYVVISPLLVHYLYEDPSVRTIKFISKKNDVPVIDFTNNPSFVTNDLFAYDGTHLNDKGARKFTGQVIDSIMKDQKVRIPKEDLANKQNVSNN